MVQVRLIRAGDHAARRRMTRASFVTRDALVVPLGSWSDDDQPAWMAAARAWVIGLGRSQASRGRQPSRSVSRSGSSGGPGGGFGSRSAGFRQPWRQARVPPLASGERPVALGR